jgi:hypothetical protein
MNRYYLLLIFLLAIPCVLWWLPAAAFDEGTPTCLSVLILGKTCPGCGLTRGVMHLLHFDIETALYYNPLSFIALPVLGWIWLRWVRDTWRRARATATP